MLMEGLLRREECFGREKTGPKPERLRQVQQARHKPKNEEDGEEGKDGRWWWSWSEMGRGSGGSATGEDRQTGRGRPEIQG